MGRPPLKIKVAARKKPKQTPQADPEDDGAAELAKRAAEIQERLRTDQPVSKEEVRVLDAFLQAHGPAATRGVEPSLEDKAAPPDLLLPSLRKIAEVLGVHYNTLDNWKRKGIEPVGTSPWSLKAFLLILRPANKLSECRPTNDKAKALWQWAFGVRGLGSVNPDDPAHGPTIGWGEERDRQGALKEMTARKSAWLDLEKKAGRLKEDDAVRHLLGELRQIVISELSTVQSVANLVRGLSPTQRADLADQLTAWQARARKSISDQSDRLMGSKDPTHGVPG